MAGLGDTVAALASYRRLAQQPVDRGGVARHTLVEVSGWGPNPGALRMLTYTPAGLPKGAPLVVVLHGCSQDALAYAEGAGWLALADRYGFSVLCPEQTSANNANRCFNWFQPEDIHRGGGEALSIRQMVARALLDQSGDPKRVFVTGLSAGGAMTSVMLATYPEVFAAGAIVAGLPFGAANAMHEAFSAMFQSRSRPATEWGDLVRAASPYRGPWPRLSIWHGEADTTVHPRNADEAAKQWANVWDLSAQPSRSFDGPRQSLREWRDAQGQVAIEQIMVKGLAHGAPIAAAGADGCGTAGPFVLEAGVSSSLEIARFWSLAERRPTVDTAAGQDRPIDMPAPALFTPAAANDPFAAVERVITDALRTAGLMKQRPS